MGKGVDLAKQKAKRQNERAIRVQISEDSRMARVHHNRWYKGLNSIDDEGHQFDFLGFVDDDEQPEVEHDLDHQHEPDEADLPLGGPAAPPGPALLGQLPIVQLPIDAAPLGLALPGAAPDHPGPLAQLPIVPLPMAQHLIGAAPLLPAPRGPAPDRAAPHRQGLAPPAPDHAALPGPAPLGPARAVPDHVAPPGPE